MSREIEFGSYLRKLRKERGLSIRRLEEMSGVSNAYLSQIENGKRGLPSPEILKKIYEPLDVGYTELMEKAGYISTSVKSELIPETIEALESTDALSELISNAGEYFISSVTDGNGVLKEDYKEYLINEAQERSKLDSEEVKEFFDEHPNNILQILFRNLTFEEKISFLNTIIKDLSDKGIDHKDVLKSEPINIESNKVQILRVPVLGYIAAGLPILAEDHIEEWIEIPNMWNLKDNQAIVLKVKGDSMIGSRIYEGDKVVVKLQQEIENGEIAVVNINGDEATLKRVKKTESGQVILYPDNPRYEPTFITNESARIIGKVIQVMFEPKKL
ncbi:transcriptional repressor LexA [Peribacillus frigoritolerans]|uniref:transcriptional repressor LexA n=1 Tax=Peribacillus frigoritolerans TaxID=450367 RepID=UPI002079354A|nr:transcriptional repressor LexA [Peribacillus frigoritolerans]USK66269.1 transcriptional repressor LexA [Peribacillus frigoritolerans]